MKLILDAGHGFNTAGKRTPDDIREWTLNNRVAVAFQNEIAKYDIEVIRTDDPTGETDVTLNQRDAIGKQGDVLLSIHHNAFRGVWGDHGGTETLIQPGKEKDRAYATAMNNSIVNTLGLRNRGIKVMNTQVLRNFTKGVSCLVEVGFMDSNTDRIIRDPNASARVGKNLATDFAKFFNLKLRDGKSPDVVPSNDVSIDGPSRLSAGQITAFVRSQNENFNSEIVDHFISVGNKYGIRGDIAVAQSILETGWFKFVGSSVKPEQNNFCGLGATGGGNPGNSFNSIKDGVTAQIQHLYAYSNKKELPSGEALLDPRFKFVTRGIAPTWIGLNGRWATGANYGQKILTIYNDMVKFTGVTPDVPKPKPNPTPVSNTKYKVGDVVKFSQLSTQASGGTVKTSSINSGTITKIYPGTSHPYLINSGSGFVNDGMIGAGAPQPSGEPKVGDVVKFSQLSTQASGGTVKTSSITSGTITKIYPGTTHPYLINGGSGFINKAMINGSAPKKVREPQVGDTVRFTQLSTQANGGRLVESSITSGKITKIYPGTSHPYLINNGSGFVNKAMIGK